MSIIDQIQEVVTLLGNLLALRLICIHGCLSKVVYQRRDPKSSVCT